MRMSVLVQNKIDHSLKLFIKGSPEKIKELSKKSSVPSNFDEI